MEDTEILKEHIVEGAACEQPVEAHGVNLFSITATSNEGVEYVLQLPFQNGLPSEVGRNGITNEEAIVMVLHRLRTWNKGDFACRENSVAITKLEEALMWLQKRTRDRLSRGVEGTYNK